MIVYTSFTLDMGSGELLAAEGFEYHGPVALCDGGAGGGDGSGDAEGDSASGLSGIPGADIGDAVSAGIAAGADVGMGASVEGVSGAAPAAAISASSSEGIAGMVAGIGGIGQGSSFGGQEGFGAAPGNLGEGQGVASESSINVSNVISTASKAAMLGMSVLGIPGLVAGAIAGAAVSMGGQGGFGGLGAAGGENADISADSAGPEDSAAPTSVVQMPTENQAPAESPPTGGLGADASTTPEQVDTTTQAEARRQQLRQKMGYYSSRHTFGQADALDIFTPGLFAVN